MTVPGSSPPIVVNVYEKDISLTRRQMGWTRDKFTLSLLKPWLKAQILPYPSPRPIAFNSSLDSEIENFAERLAAGAIANIQRYFSL